MKKMVNKPANKNQGALFFLKQKLRILLFIAGFISVSFSGFTQEQRVSLNLKDVSIEDFLKEIQKQTKLNYIFNHEELPKNTQITISVKNETVNKTLEKCFKDLNLSFKIVNNVIVITPKPKPKTTPLSQIIRGTIVDSETQAPLPFSTVAVVTCDPVLGTTSDENGNFRLENVPVGRHKIEVSYVGYEMQSIPELLVSTGKEIILTLKLKERVSKVNEVSVKAHDQKDKPLNSMSSVSARSFSVEEARRYAGGFDDPARLAASFAGITTENSRDNTIIIRGNSPKGLLWRLEGVEIPNPNHFANLATFGGGGMSALSALVVGNSDFFTGAFPAEYGNAMSGVFDIKLRTGNNEKHEHAFQLGTMGIDLSSEGPLSKKKKASYLFNYRYSTLGLMKEILPDDIKSFLPVYQDLCFKVNFPTKKSGIFSVWGIASADESAFPALTDSAKWEKTLDRIDNKVTLSMGAVGVNHRYIFKKNAWLNTSLSLSGDNMNYSDEFLGNDFKLYPLNTVNVLNYKYSFTSIFNHKYSAKHTNRTGIIINSINYDIDLQYAAVLQQGLISMTKEKGSSNLFQMFSQSKFNISKHILVNAGLHGQYFGLNGEYVIEPRLGLNYTINHSQVLSFAYGKHSRVEPLSLYFAKVHNGSSITQPNQKLKLSKAHHLVLAYDINLNSNLRLKIEPYLQLLYDVPVIPDSNYSVLNLEAEWYSFDKQLINKGTGKNLGIDFTLERFLKNGYYYLITASLFDSKFKGEDGVEHNTRFNTRYVVNFLYGKEWVIGSQQNKILGLNLKVNFFGGKRTTPINQEQSALTESVIYDYSQLFEEKERDHFNVNATVNYRINKAKHAIIWSFQMMNVFLAKENYGYFYNYRSKRVEPWKMAVPTPNFSFKIEF